MRVTATCPTGDVLSSSRTRLSVRLGDANITSGVFDLPDAPIVLPRNDSGSIADNAVERQFHFPISMFWRVPDSLPQPTTNTSGAGGSIYVVECEQGGVSAGAPSGEFTVVSSATAYTATEAAPPSTGDKESASFDALRAIADADAPGIIRTLEGRWVPQIPGLVAEGITWDNSETLREHLELRLRYPDVKLMWSGERNVLSYDNFWVTIAGAGFGDKAGANAWCDQQRLDRDHCFAKLISRTHPVEGSTGSR